MGRREEKTQLKDGVENWYVQQQKKNNRKKDKKNRYSYRVLTMFKALF